MSGRIYAPVLNPFSREARKIAKEAPPFDSLPRDVIDLAVKRVTWKSGNQAKVDLEEENIRREVLSFYLMCQSVASVSHPYSVEVRKIMEATSDTIKYRLYDFFKRGHEESCLDVIRRSFKLRKLENAEEVKLGGTIIPREDLYKLRDLALQRDGIEIGDKVLNDTVFSKYLPRYAIRWTDMGSLMKHRELDLTERYLVDGWALVTPKELWDFFAGLVSSELMDYVSSLYDDYYSKSGLPSELLEKVGERISNAIPKKMVRKDVARVKREKIYPECFPPCVEKAMEGVGSGNRNYAIVVLLSSFLSYARISPSGKAVRRIADFVDDISVIEDEVIPLVFGAAKKCNPPLFEDQPQDKPNVYYHLGFGMTTQPRLKDSGKSKWYRPPNCRKIKIEAPSLCSPDDLCNEIKNPLTYYYKKLSEKSKSD